MFKTNESFTCIEDARSKLQKLSMDIPYLVQKSDFNRLVAICPQKCGFRIIGYREKVGCLNGIWKNNIIMERRSKRVGI